MSTYVLVHGAWHGGWCWERLRDRLAPSGASIYTPTLTGLGDRLGHSSPSVGLETHIADVLQVAGFRIHTGRSVTPCHELSTGHDAMVLVPGELAQLLASIS